MTKRTIILTLLACCFILSPSFRMGLGGGLAQAQMVDPVHWTMKASEDGGNVVVTLRATIDRDWHIYAMDLPDGGPKPLSITWRNEGLRPVGKLQSAPAPHVEHDKTFDMDLGWWAGRVTLTQRFKPTAKTWTVAGSVAYQACNGVSMMCVAPASYEFRASASPASGAAGTAGGEQSGAAVEEQSGAAALHTNSLDSSGRSQTPESATGAAGAEAGSEASAVGGDTWAPVTAAATTDSPPSGGVGGGLLFWMCAAGGLLALLTPCVWPIIPLTVSFFLKQGGSARRGILLAVVYGLSIVVIYVGLGLIITALFGADALNTLATSAVANIVFAALLIVFALSFFGAFELELPSSWSTRLDTAAGNAGGVLSAVFMALTLVIVSFSCTGPIIGTLLVTAAGGGSRMAPAVGMLGFSLALAVPFTLFAMFPTWLKRLPRSGGWMQTVKVVLGFLELAFALKFLSVADLAYGWHILDREWFLALWIVIFGLLGLYLLGVFRFKGEEPADGVGVTRVMLAGASLALTVYLVPGLWGAPLRGVSAFVPPLYTQDFVLDGSAAQTTFVDDYDRALELSRASGKPVFIDFSGYGCVNCRKMEGAVLERESVKSLLDSRFITARLIVDDRTALPSPRVVTEDGKQVTLTTVGQLWSYLQRHKFGANSQPYYVVVDADGRLLAGPRAYDEDIDAFVAFLRSAL